MHRRPRSEFLIIPPVPRAAPLMRSVRPLYEICTWFFLENICIICHPLSWSEDMLKELLTKESLEVLNSFGLGLLIIGLIIVYRSLTLRAKSLSENLSDIKGAYDSVVDVMAKRAKELDMRFEDEKRFRSFYLSIVDDTEAHQAKVKK